MTESPALLSDAHQSGAPQLVTRGDQYRDLLEAWVQWWNHLGRYHYRHPGIPPLTATGDALRCTACAGVGPYEAENGPDRCQVCHRRLP